MHTRKQSCWTVSGTYFSNLLEEGRLQSELQSKHVINLFTSVQSRYADALDVTSVKTRISKFSKFGKVNFELRSC